MREGKYAIGNSQLSEICFYVSEDDYSIHTFGQGCIEIFRKAHVILVNDMTKKKEFFSGDTDGNSPE